jgi:error-prone DNA polymerase
VRLGLRYVKGLRESAGRAIVEARRARSFSSPHDLAQRAGLARDELETLAEIGALNALGGTRRGYLWTTAYPHPGPLFTDSQPAKELRPHPLAEMTVEERLAADYRGTGVTLGPHPMALRRATLTTGGVVSAAALAGLSAGRRVRVAGSVIVRQRPGTAKGFVFLSLEDETGIINIIVRPALFARQRLILVSEPFLLVEGILQTQDGVVSVRADRVRPLPRPIGHIPSHDFG